MINEPTDYGILIVDDSPFVTEVLKIFLEQRSKNVFVASNGREGLQIYRQKNPQLIITDVLMPVMNGLEMSKEIKNSNKNAFIVMTTAMEETEHLAEAIEISIDKYLPKPIDLKRLEKIIDDFENSLASKKIIEENRKLLEEYKKALDAMAIFTLSDAKGVIKYVNDEFCRVTEYSREEALGKDYSMLRHPDMPKKVFISMWKTIMGKKIWKGVVENLTKNGESFFVDATIVPILDVEQNIVEFIGIFYDITMLKDMSERNLQSIFNADESPIIVTDEKYNVKIANKAMLKMLKTDNIWNYYEKGSSIYQNFLNKEGFLSRDNLFGSSAKERFRKFKKILTEGDRQQRKVAMLDADGNERYYAVRVNTVSNKMLKSRHYNIFSFVDITELEIMREQQVNNIKLSSIGKLAAGITHEINTPLTYIKGNMELLKMELENECSCDIKSDTLAYCDAIEDGLKRMIAIVESMREIAGVSKSEKTQINVFTTVVYAMRMVYNRAKQICNLTINGELFDMSLDKSRQKMMLLATPQRLEQIWIIILNNALDEFVNSELPFEKRFIDVRILENLGTISIEIRDNAGGIKESLLSQIFEMFKSSKPQSGMGVGLTIAKAIVEDHNGIIKAYNEGGGAVFEIVFSKDHSTES